jgi:hypothetical protein
VGYGNGGKVLRTSIKLVFFILLVLFHGRESVCDTTAPDSVLTNTTAPKDSIFAFHEALKDSVLSIGALADTLSVKKPVKSLPEPTMKINPSTAMYHSLALPGWGQLNNGRHKKALLFIAAETFFIGGYLYLNYELRTNNYNVYQKEQTQTDRNSYVLYWVFAKIFDIVDAYVDAQLADYNVNDITPEDLKK